MHITTVYDSYHQEWRGEVLDLRTRLTIFISINFKREADARKAARHFVDKAEPFC